MDRLADRAVPIALLLAGTIVAILLYFHDRGSYGCSSSAQSIAPVLLPGLFQHHFRTTDVWIIAGQSNSAGENDLDNQPLPQVSRPYPGRILMFTANRTWEDAVPNIHRGMHGHNIQAGVGPDMAFARTLVEADVSTRVGLVPTALGGSYLYRSWMPGKVLFNTMVQHTRAALEALPGAQLRGMIWVQGECDALEEGAAQNYTNHFKRFLAAAQAELVVYNPRLVVVMGVMAAGPRTVVFPYLEEVRRQQQEMRIRDLLKVDMAGYEFYIQQYPPAPAGPIHLTKQGISAFGASMAYVYMKYLADQAVVAAQAKVGEQGQLP